MSFNSLLRHCPLSKSGLTRPGILDFGEENFAYNLVEFHQFTNYKRQTLTSEDCIILFS